MPAAPPDLEALIITAAAVVTALGVLWRKVIRPSARACRTLYATYEEAQTITAGIAELQESRKHLVTRDEFHDELLGVYRQIASRDVVAAATQATDNIGRLQDSITLHIPAETR